MGEKLDNVGAMGVRWLLFFMLRKATEAELIAEVKVNLMSISVLLNVRHVSVSDIYYLLLLFVSTELLFRNLIFRGKKNGQDKNLLTF